MRCCSGAQPARPRRGAAAPAAAARAAREGVRGARADARDVGGAVRLADGNAMIPIISTLSATISTLSAKISALNAIISTLSATISTLSAIISTLSGIISTLSATISTLSASISTLSASISTLRRRRSRSSRRWYRDATRDLIQNVPPGVDRNSNGPAPLSVPSLRCFVLLSREYQRPYCDRQFPHREAHRRSSARWALQRFFVMLHRRTGATGVQARDGEAELDVRRLRPAGVTGATVGGVSSGSSQAKGTE